MDKYDGENYKIIVGDAFKYLDQYEKENKKFDVIFGDLTDIPIHEGDSTWSFVTNVIKSSLKLLPVGRNLKNYFQFFFLILLFRRKIYDSCDWSECCCCYCKL